jgi:hypothetical protein
MTGALMLLIFIPLGASGADDALTDPPHNRNQVRRHDEEDTYVRRVQEEP